MMEIIAKVNKKHNTSDKQNQIPERNPKMSVHRLDHPLMKALISGKNMNMDGKTKCYTICM